MIDGVRLTAERCIPGEAGEVRHVARASSTGVLGFGECYASTVHQGARKGWTRHRLMTLNLVALHGRVRVTLVDGRASSPTHDECWRTDLDAADPHRLTVPPGIWTALEGLGETPNILVNVADMEHDPEEQEKRPLDDPTLGEHVPR